jgi:ATP-dependent Lon protease
VTAAATGPAKRPRARKPAKAPEEAPSAEPSPVTPQSVEPDDLRTLLGVAPYDPDDTSLDDKVGVATGLAYTSVGGETLEVEVAVVRGRAKVQHTAT